MKVGRSRSHSVCGGCTCQAAPNVATDDEIASARRRRSRSPARIGRAFGGARRGRVPRADRGIERRGPSFTRSSRSIPTHCRSRASSTGAAQERAGWAAPRPTDLDQGERRYRRPDGDECRLARACGHRAAADAPVVARLRAAGAVILGKTNLSEWANFRSTRSTSGWSSLGGQTRNPYVLDRSPCGSSSGSAVAVAAALAPLALGTETDGSIVCPAAANGVAGIKPTLGLVSGRGIVPIAHSQDTAGPIARNVRDAALLMRAIEEPGARPDAPTWPSASSRATRVRERAGDARPPHGRAARRRARLLWGRQRSRARRRLRRWLEVATRPRRGARRPARGRRRRGVESAELTVLLHEFRVQIDAYLRDVSDGPRSLDELVAFDAAHGGRRCRSSDKTSFWPRNDDGPRFRPLSRRRRIDCTFRDTARRDLRGPTA